MNSRLLLLASVLILLSCTACSIGGDDDDEFSLEGTNVSVVDIAGTWNATKALFSKSATGPVMEVDVVAEGGAVTLQIQNDGRFSVAVTLPGSDPETSTGRLGFDEDLLVISFDDDPEEFEFFSITHNEPNLAIQGGTVYEAFDFDGDGADEDADIDFELVRSS